MKTKQSLVVLTATLAAFASVVGLGVAAWSTGNAGAGTTRATSLDAPTSVGATAGNAQITVTVNVGPVSPAATGYVVKLGATAECTISGATGSCVASGLTNGTSTTLNVFSTRNSWTSTSNTPVTATPVAPAISVSPSTTKKSSNGNSTSDTVTVTGSHFAANSSLTAAVSGGAITTNISKTTDSSGNVQANTTFVMNNPIATGSVTVTVTDGSGNSATANFTVTPN